MRLPISSDDAGIVFMFGQYGFYCSQKSAEFNKYLNKPEGKQQFGFIKVVTYQQFKEMFRIQVSSVKAKYLK